MIFRSVFLFAIVVCAVLRVSAQDEWHSGSVTLKNNNVLKGDISFWSGRDAIMLSSGEASMVIPAFRIKSLTYYDKESESQKTFVTIPGSVGAATMFQFYELILDGTISVLRQKHLYWYSIRVQTSDYDYFVLKDDQLLPMNKFRREIYPSIEKDAPELSEFSRKERISLFNVDDTIRLIQYYNDRESGFASIR